MFFNTSLLKTINNQTKIGTTLPIFCKDNYFLQTSLQSLQFFSNTEKQSGKTASAVIIKELVSIPFFSMYKLAETTITPLIVLLLLHFPFVSLNYSFIAFINSVIGFTPPFKRASPIHFLNILFIFYN